MRCPASAFEPTRTVLGENERPAGAGLRVHMVERKRYAPTTISLTFVATIFEDGTLPALVPPLGRKV